MRASPEDVQKNIQNWDLSEVESWYEYIKQGGDPFYAFLRLSLSGIDDQNKTIEVAYSADAQKLEEPWKENIKKGVDTFFENYYNIRKDNSSLKVTVISFKADKDNSHRNSFALAAIYSLKNCFGSSAFKTAHNGSLGRTYQRWIEQGDDIRFSYSDDLMWMRSKRGFYSRHDRKIDRTKDYRATSKDKENIKSSKNQNTDSSENERTSHFSSQEGTMDDLKNNIISWDLSKLQTWVYFKKQSSREHFAYLEVTLQGIDDQKKGIEILYTENAKLLDERFKEGILKGMERNLEICNEYRNDKISLLLSVHEFKTHPYDSRALSFEIAILMAFRKFFSASIFNSATIEKSYTPPLDNHKKKEAGESFYSKRNLNSEGNFKKYKHQEKKIKSFDLEKYYGLSHLVLFIVACYTIHSFTTQNNLTSWISLLITVVIGILIFNVFWKKYLS